ncbi:hypothetical protein BO94DRAFT_468625, partial [Aspergillus sclerotioniger CBS 115572]
KIQIKIITKLGVGLFLCLSIFIFVCAIVQDSGTFYQSTLDYPWKDFWLHIKAYIRVTMGSLTAYQSTLVSDNKASDKMKAGLYKLTRLIHNLRVSLRYPSQPGGNEIRAATGKPMLFPSIPRPTLGTLRAWLGNRTERDFNSLQSYSYPLLDQTNEHHDFIRPPRVAKGKGLG